MLEIGWLCGSAPNLGLGIDACRIEGLGTFHALLVFTCIAEGELSLLHPLLELLPIFVHVLRQLVHRQRALIQRFVQPLEFPEREVGLLEVLRRLHGSHFA